MSFLAPDPGQRILVLESTALIALFGKFNHSLQPIIDLMQEPVGASRGALFQRVVIPDQVFYEVTGIMPGVQKEMLRELSMAKQQGDAPLKYVIERYVRASPRVGNPTGQRDDLRKEVRELLRFVALYPDNLVTTHTGTRCHEKTVAEHALFSNTASEAMLDARLSHGDLRATLGTLGTLDDASMPLHINQLYLWGMFDKKGEQSENYPRGFRELAEKRENFGTVKRRFFSTNDLFDLLEHHGTVNSEQKKSLRQHYPKNREATLSLLREHPEFLPKISDGLRNTSGPEHYDADQAMAPSKLNLLQWMTLGLLPQDEASVSVMENQFGFAYPAGPQEVAMLDARRRERGFYEYVPTLGDLTTLLPSLPPSPEAEKLAIIVQQAPKKVRTYRRSRLTEECRLPQEALTKGERKVPYIGIPYEKAFSEALISGAMQWPEFLAIAEKSHALDKDGTHYTTRSRDLLIDSNEKRPEASRVFVRQKGFMTRSGFSELPYMERKGEQPGGNTGSKSEEYYTALSIEELLAHCREALGSVEKQRFYRVFDAILFPTARIDAAKLRDAAEDVLGAEKLARIEKDFSNRHFRKWIGTSKEEAASQPAFTSSFASMTSDRRLLRKDMGELACAEAAARLAKETPQATIWIANHDRGLQKAASGIQVAEHVLRQQATVLKSAEQRDTVSSEGLLPMRVQLLTTGQLLVEVARQQHYPLTFTPSERDKWKPGELPPSLKHAVASNVSLTSYR